MSPSATVRLTDVFLIVFGEQWSSVAQRNKQITLWIHRQKLVSRISSLLVFVFPWDFLTIKKETEDIIRLSFNVIKFTPPRLCKYSNVSFLLCTWWFNIPHCCYTANFSWMRKYKRPLWTWLHTHTPEWEIMLNETWEEQKEEQFMIV